MNLHRPDHDSLMATIKNRCHSAAIAGQRRSLRSTVRDEAGAVLILALVALIASGAIVGSLAGMVMNDLHSTTLFASSRSLQYAATSATDLAIQSIRYKPLLTSAQTLNSSPPNYCWGNSAPSELGNIDGVSEMAVWCSTAWTPTSSNTRVVTFSACIGSVTAAACAQNPLLQAVVTYGDYPAGISPPTSAQCVVYCGTSMTINSWVWSPTVPTVTGLAVSGTTPATGPITGGTAVTITGTGFESGSTVNFIEESGGTPATDNTVLPASGVTVNSSTSITATAPSVTEGSTYYVDVSTPSGHSAYNSNDVFIYSSVAPTLTSISPATGSTAGGTAVTLTGSGFVSGATVSFIEENGGSAVVPTVVRPATSVVINSDTSLSAVSPTVTVGTTYFVTVSTPSGTTSYDSGNVFTYQELVPTVALITPTSGTSSGGTTITITGTGFVSGATVAFTEESGGTPSTPSVVLSATRVTVVSATTITAVSPAKTAGSTYFVTVTTPTGTSNYYPIYTYT